MLTEPQSTPFDLDVRVAGIPVRVSGLFWLGALFIGWNGCKSFAGDDQRQLLVYLAIWTAVVFGSLLVHELGHALAYRRFGQSARIVLYHLGGLAIPDGWRRGRLRPAERFVVSAAGPLAQLLLAGLVIGGLRFAGWVVPFPFAEVGEALGFDEGRRFSSLPLLALADFLVFVNVLWPLMNLVPVPPLDGGQMVREALETLGVNDAGRIAAGIGAAAGALVAYGAFVRGERFVAILFAMLAASCFRELQQSPPGRRWK